MRSRQCYDCSVTASYRSLVLFSRLIVSKVLRRGVWLLWRTMSYRRGWALLDGPSGKVPKAGQSKDFAKEVCRTADTESLIRQIRNFY